MSENSNSPAQEDWADFRDELRKVQRGVRVMWFVNFLLLSLIFNAGMIVAFLETTATNEQILGTLLFTTPISLVIAAIAMIIVVANSRRFVAHGLGSSTTEVESGPLYDAVEEMVIASGTGKMPRVYVDSSNVMNAYALGDSKGNAYIAFTEPLINALDRDELTAVAAHELAHINSGDSPAMVKLIALSSMISLVSSIGMRVMFYGSMGGNRGGNQGGNRANPIAIALIIISLLFLIFAPLIARLGNAFMSRQRETRADNLAVKYTRDPSALASALAKINGRTLSATSQSSQAKTDAKQFNNAIGALAFYKPNFIGRAFGTHPPFEDRIKNLQRMGAEVPEAEGLE